MLAVEEFVHKNNRELPAWVAYENTDLKPPVDVNLLHLNRNKLKPEITKRNNTADK